MPPSLGSGRRQARPPTFVGGLRGGAGITYPLLRFFATRTCSSRRKPYYPLGGTSSWWITASIVALDLRFTMLASMFTNTGVPSSDTISPLRIAVP